MLPVALTAYAVWWVLSTIEQFFHWLWKLTLPDDWYSTGFGILLGAVFICAVGVVAGAWLGRFLLGALERVLKRIPLVKTIYGSVRDLMSFFAGKKKGMSRVVIAEVVPGIRLLGFVTQENAQQLTGLPEDEGKTAVYFPMSYQVGGYMVLLPRERLTAIDMKVEDALRLAITAGIVEDGADPQ